MYDCRLSATRSLLLLFLCTLSDIARVVEANDGSDATNSETNRDNELVSTDDLSENSFWRQNMLVILIISACSVCLLLLGIVLNVVDRRYNRRKGQIDAVVGDDDNTWETV